MVDKLVWQQVTETTGLQLAEQLALRRFVVYISFKCFACLWHYFKFVKLTGKVAFYRSQFNTRI